MMLTRLVYLKILLPMKTPTAPRTPEIIAPTSANKSRVMTTYDVVEDVRIDGCIRCHGEDQCKYATHDEAAFDSYGHIPTKK
jgi:hypothetical protein